MSASLKGRAVSPETRAKIAATKTGSVASEETKAKLRASHLAFWARMRAP
jgi:hypothetical protein